MKECRAIVVDDAANIAFVITPEALIVPDTARHSSQFSISNKGQLPLPLKILLTLLLVLLLLKNIYIVVVVLA